MRRPMFTVLRAAQALFGAIAAESVATYLMAKGFALDWLSRGKSMFEKTTTLRDARDATRRLVREMTAAVRSLFEEITPEVNDVRLSARKALAKRPDLVAALGVGRKRKAAKPSQDAEAPPADGAAPKRTRPNQIVAFVQAAKGTLSGALERPEVVSRLEPYGYTRDSIAALLARVEALGAKEAEHEDRKRELMAATGVLHAAITEFRDWLLPSKKRLMTALKGRNDLRKMVNAIE